MNIDRPRLIALAMQLFNNKKLKELKKKVFALLDERFFTNYWSERSEQENRTLNMQDLTELNLRLLDDKQERIIISSNLTQATVLSPPITPQQIKLWQANHLDDGKFDETATLQRETHLALLPYLF
jgi:hypothetical protein